MTERLLTIREVADQLQMSASTVRRLVAWIVREPLSLAGY